MLISAPVDPAPYEPKWKRATDRIEQNLVGAARRAGHCGRITIQQIVDRRKQLEGAAIAGIDIHAGRHVKVEAAGDIIVVDAVGRGNGIAILIRPDEIGPVDSRRNVAAMAGQLELADGPGEDAVQHIVGHARYRPGANAGLARAVHRAQGIDGGQFFGDVRDQLRVQFAPRSDRLTILEFDVIAAGLERIGIEDDVANLKNLVVGVARDLAAEIGGPLGAAVDQRLRAQRADRIGHLDIIIIDRQTQALERAAARRDHETAGPAVRLFNGKIGI